MSNEKLIIKEMADLLHEMAGDMWVALEVARCVTDPACQEIFEEDRIKVEKLLKRIKEEETK
jgi:hypothetical protein